MEFRVGQMVETKPLEEIKKIIDQPDFEKKYPIGGNEGLLRYIKSSSKKRLRFKITEVYEMPSGGRRVDIEEIEGSLIPDICAVSALRIRYAIPQILLVNTTKQSSTLSQRRRINSIRRLLREL